MTTSLTLAPSLDSAGVDFTILGSEEWCCGHPLISAGHKKAAVKSMQHNIDRIKKMVAKSVVMTCPGCYRMWRDEYHDITSQRPPKVNEILATGIQTLVTACPACVKV